MVRSPLSRDGQAAGRRASGLGQRGRPQLALPAGTSGQPAGPGRAAQYSGTGSDGHTRQYGMTGQFARTGPFDQLGGGHPSGPMPQFAADHPSGPFERPPFDQPPFDRAQSGGSRYERTGETDQPGRPHRHLVRGQSEWIAAYERPLGAQRPVLPADHPSASFDRPVLPADHPSASFDRPVLPADHPSASFDRPQFDQPLSAPLPRYEMTGEIDRPAMYQPILPPEYQPLLPADHPSAPFERPRFDQPMGYGPRDRAAAQYQQPVPASRYPRPVPPDPRDEYSPAAPGRLARPVPAWPV